MDIEKPNCIGCHHIHPDNGNCTAVGGFCTAVPAAHCPLIPELRAENEKLLDENRRWSESTRTLSCAIENLRDELNDLKAQFDMYGGDEGITATFAELEQVKQDRDAAVEGLRQMCVGGNTCAFCKESRVNCKRMGPGRKTVEPCWTWRGQKED